MRRRLRARVPRRKEAHTPAWCKRKGPALPGPRAAGAVPARLRYWLGGT
jgi:hypothetical protein